MSNTIEFTRIKNDINGNPRHVCSFLNFITYEEQQKPEKYAIAIKRANKIGGKKFSNKQYGGGIVFQEYAGRLKELEEMILELVPA